MIAARLLRALMTPGLYLKRWVALCVLGAGLAFWGLHRLKGELDKYQLKENLQLMLIIVGVGLMLLGLYKLVSSALKVAGFTRQAFWNNVFDQGVLARGPKVVVIGGGTGLANLLSGLKEFTSNITACVTVTDEGGSSGRLRDEFGIVAPGDIRNCVVALSSAPALLSELFNYRFQEGDGLKGHSFGNLFIAALTRITGSFDRAVEESCRVLSTRGRVFPLTRANIRLVARMEDGSEIRGETNIGMAGRPIRRLMIEPPVFQVNPDVIDAIRVADLVIVGPGSLYTSILPNLLAPETRQALRATSAPVIYISNVMTQPGETAQFTASDHVRVIYDHIGEETPRLFDWIVVNTQSPPEGYVERYRQEGAAPVRVDVDALRRLGLRVLAGDFLKGDVPVMTAEGQKHVLRHDARKIAEKIVALRKVS